MSGQATERPGLSTMERPLRKAFTARGRAVAALDELANRLGEAGLEVAELAIRRVAEELLGGVVGDSLFEPQKPTLGADSLNRFLNARKRLERELSDGREAMRQTMAAWQQPDGSEVTKEYVTELLIG